MTKKKLCMKICSLSLAYVMCFGVFGGFSAFAENGQTQTATAAGLSDRSILSYENAVYGEAWDGTTTDTEWASAGENAYYITSVAELAGLMATNAVHATYENVTFYVTKNLDFGGSISDDGTVTNSWASVSSGQQFRGSLIGCLGGDTDDDHVHGKDCAQVYFKNFVIDGRQMNGAQAHRALFFYHAKGTLKNMTMVNPIGIATAYETGFFVGQPVTYAAASYENLAVIGGTYHALNTTKIDAIGGIVGRSRHDSSFTNCYADFDVMVKENSAEFSGVGGIVGRGQKLGDIINCETTVDVLNTADVVTNSFGGFIGYIEAWNGKIENCKTDFTFTCESTVAKKQIGGVAGSIPSVTTTAKNCVTKLTITSKSSDMHYVGGIYGVVAGLCNVTDCVTELTFNKPEEGTAIEDITPQYLRWAGGITGGGEHKSIFKGCSSTLDVTAKGWGDTKNQMIAGIDSWASNSTVGGTYEDCHSYGSVLIIGDATRLAGGGIISNIDVKDYIIKSCSSDIDFTVTGAAIALGGLVGQYGSNYLKMTDCLYTGNITVGAGSTQIGGVAGNFNGRQFVITNCDSNGTITVGESSTAVGGIVGNITAAALVGDGMAWSGCDATGAIVCGESKTLVMIGNDLGKTLSMDDCTLTMNGKAVDASTLELKYQVYEGDDAADDTEMKTLRMVSTIDSDLDAYNKVGFKVIYTNDGQSKTVYMETSTVYSAVTGGGYTYSPSEKEGYTSAGYGENSAFFFVVDLIGVPTDTVLTVQAYVILTDGTTVYGNIKTADVATLVAAQ